MLTNDHKMAIDLCSYHLFFKLILAETASVLGKQNVYGIEWRHKFGELYDENGPIGIDNEL